MNNGALFSTFDLSLATTISLFFPLEAIERDGTRARFLFKREDGLDKIIEAYWRRDLKVEPQSYFQQLRFIKTRLYERK
jgi:hypothetical protein